MIRFLFAADFSKANVNALKYAKDLMTGHDIVLDMVHVYDVPFAYTTETPARALKGYLSELKAAAIKRMEDMMNTIDEKRRGTLYPINGIYPAVEIHECAESIDADLIIMSLREDYGLLKRLMGTTTARTIHKTKVPVLAIPAHAQYKRVEDVLFPTILNMGGELSEREDSALKWLTGFSGFLNDPNIELLHIIDDEKKNKMDITMIGAPYNDMKLTCSHAYTVEEGILEYMQRKKPDLLAFYKPHRTFWERLYRPGRTRNLLYDSNIPLIIFG